MKIERSKEWWVEKAKQEEEHGLWPILIKLALERVGFRLPGESDFDLVQRAIRA